MVSVEEAEAALAAGVDGLVAVGNEAGGWVGEDTTFILLQARPGSYRSAGVGAWRNRAAVGCRLPGRRRCRGDS